jgi:hypothetical protein
LKISSVYVPGRLSHISESFRSVEGIIWEIRSCLRSGSTSLVVKIYSFIFFIVLSYSLDVSNIFVHYSNSIQKAPNSSILMFRHIDWRYYYLWRIRNYSFSFIHIYYIHFKFIIRFLNLYSLNLNLLVTILLTLSIEYALQFVVRILKLQFLYYLFIKRIFNLRRLRSILDLVCTEYSLLKF